MAEFAYIDETGSARRGKAPDDPYLTLVAVLVDEDKVQPLSGALQRVAVGHLGYLPADFEFHGYELWGGLRWWSGKGPAERIAAYEAAIGLLGELRLSVAHSTIDKGELHARYDGMMDGNAYLLALQFLLEKIDQLWWPGRKIVVADEAKEQQLRAIRMVADMQQWGTGEVPGTRLRTVNDSLHFVQSSASPGVQMADLVAYILQRSRRSRERHPDAAAALARLRETITCRTVTWREPWPRPR